MSNSQSSLGRILVIDDNEAIHEDFRKVLQGQASDSELHDAAAAFFGEGVAEESASFEIETASQGRTGYEMVAAAIASGNPYSMAFVDMRMPPGWDGIETIQHLWQVDPMLPVVVCTAYSDYSFDEMTEKLGFPERWLLLKKPFDHAEVRQFAYGLTEKRQLATQANLKLSDLEELVEERTREVTAAKEQLLQSQKLESLGTLAGGIAHEFNNLLQVIRGYAQFIRGDLADDSPILPDLDQIVTASDRAADLTGRLLGFSRRQTLQNSVFPASQLLEELSGLLKPVIGERVTLTLNCQCPRAIIDGDSGQLQQALLNLCVNARDAMPDGGSLAITAETVEGPLLPGSEDATDADQPVIEIRVSDTGTGMPEEVRQRVFDPFFTTKEVGEGTGLGLPFVHGVIQDHGGTIEVTSEENEGTEFIVRLPLCEESSSKSDEPTRVETDTSFTEVEDNIELLVVEDEEAVRRLSVRTLESAGYRVHAAANGEEAIEQYNAHCDQISLCILDMVLPDMSGRRIATALREIRPDTRILFCTGYDPEEQFDPTMCNAEEVMRKPFDPAQLKSTVGRLTLPPAVV